MKKATAEAIMLGLPLSSRVLYGEFAANRHLQ